MALEVGSFVNDLVATNPIATDPVGQGDDHLRLIKSCVVATFPQMGANFGKAMKQDASVTITALQNTQSLFVNASSTTTTLLTLPTSASVTAGWYIDINTLTNGSATITPTTGSINGVASFSIPTGMYARITYQGASVWRAIQHPNGLSTNIFGGMSVLDILSVSGAAHFNTTVSIGGAATLASTLTVSGAATFQGVISVSGAAHFKTTVSVGGTASFAGIISVSGGAHFNTTVSVGGAATLASTLTVSGAAVFLGALTVAGTATISGTVVLSNGQIKFPATENRSNDANVLDDYEEGTFTPTVTFGTPGTLAVTYSSQSGSYVKIGAHISVTIYLVTASFVPGTASGNFLINGIPFATVAGPGVHAGALIHQGATLDAGYTQTSIASAVAGSASLLTYQSGSNKVPGVLTATQWNGALGAIIYASFSYHLRV